MAREGIRLQNIFDVFKSSCTELIIRQEPIRSFCAFSSRAIDAARFLPHVSSWTLNGPLIVGTIQRAILLQKRPWYFPFTQLRTHLPKPEKYRATDLKNPIRLRIQKCAKPVKLTELQKSFLISNEASCLDHAQALFVLDSAIAYSNPLLILRRFM